jgi:hypothetical protein
MRPCFSISNRPDIAARPSFSVSVCAGNLERSHSPREKRADFFNVGVFEQRGPVVFASQNFLMPRSAAIWGLKSCFYSMVVVFPTRDPFEVTKRIVGLVSVFVISFRLFMVRSDKGKEYQTGNAAMFMLSIFVKPHMMIAAIVNTWLKGDTIKNVASWVHGVYRAASRYFVATIVAVNRFCGIHNFIISLNIRQVYSLFGGYFHEC